MDFPRRLDEFVRALKLVGVNDIVIVVRSGLEFGRSACAQDRPYYRLLSADLQGSKFSDSNRHTNEGVWLAKSWFWLWILTRLKIFIMVLEFSLNKVQACLTLH